jgi:hypothetical protein
LIAASHDWDEVGSPLEPYAISRSYPPSYLSARGYLEMISRSASTPRRILTLATPSNAAVSRPTSMLAIQDGLRAWPALSNNAATGTFAWRAQQNRPEGPTRPYRFSLVWRFIVLYAALYGAFGVLSPFLPRFLEQRGLSAQEIGTLLAAGTTARLASGPLAGRLADRWGAWRSLLAGCAAAAAIAATLYLPFDSFWPLLIVSLIQATALAPLAPLADAITVILAVTVACRERVRAAMHDPRLFTRSTSGNSRLSFRLSFRARMA